MQLGSTSSNGTFRRKRAQTVFDFNQGNRMFRYCWAAVRFYIRSKKMNFDLAAAAGVSDRSSVPAFVERLVQVTFMRHVF